MAALLQKDLTESVIKEKENPLISVCFSSSNAVKETTVIEYSTEGLFDLFDSFAETFASKKKNLFQFVYFTAVKPYTLQA